MSAVPEDIKRLSEFLDSKFRAPGGFRFGWDALLGLVPGVGDFLTSTLSLYIIARAARLGCSVPVLMRMGLNVLIENIFDTIPLLGNIFDFLWKANNKNLKLLEAHLARPRATTRASMAVIWGTLALIALALIGVLVGALVLLKIVIEAL